MGSPSNPKILIFGIVVHFVFFELYFADGKPKNLYETPSKKNYNALLLDVDANTISPEINNLTHIREICGSRNIADLGCGSKMLE